MLRAFFLIFVLVTIAWLAVFGFRGQKSSKPEIEIFPDMVRQPKVRAQSRARISLPDQRGARQPVEGTVPIGYEMPLPNDEGTAVDAAGEMAMHPRLGFSEGTDYLQYRQNGRELGHRNSARSDAGADATRRTALQYQLRGLPRPAGGR